MTWVHTVTALAALSFSLIFAQVSSQTTPTPTGKPADTRKQPREYGFDAQSATLIDMANQYRKFLQ